jgi:hypothetical protein
MPSQPADLWMPLALFLLFALLSAAGAYLAVAHARGRTAGVWAAVGTILFFGALLAGLWALMRGGGVL